MRLPPLPWALLPSLPLPAKMGQTLPMPPWSRSDPFLSWVPLSGLRNRRLSCRTGAQAGAAAAGAAAASFSIFLPPRNL
jgi:hypothetical protein